MAFQFSEGGVPYHPPQAPELPGRVNIPQGDFVGNSIVNAFVHKAIADEQAQLEQKQMMQNADLQAQRLTYQDKWQTQDHDIAQQNADSLDKYRSAEASYFVSNKTARDKAAADRLAAQEAAKALMTDYGSAVHTLDGKSIPAAQPLINPENIRTRPGNVLAGIGDWKIEYGGAKTGATETVEKQLDKIAADMKVPWVPGAQYVDSKGQSTLTNKNDPLAWRVPSKADATTGTVLWQSVQPGDIQQTALKDVAGLYNDPTQRAQVANGLIAAGHGTIAEDTQTERIPWSLAKKTTTTKTPTLDPWANRLLLDLGARRASVGSHVPEAMRYSPKQFMIKAGVGGTESPSGGGDIDGERERANQAISANPAAEAAIRAYFEQKNGEPL